TRSAWLPGRGVQRQRPCAHAPDTLRGSELASATDGAPRRNAGSARTIMSQRVGESATGRYLAEIGVRETPRATCPFDPGYDPATLEGHMQQSGHLIGTVKISMACWMVADESATRRKIRAVTELGITAVAGGGPFETA